MKDIKFNGNKLLRIRKGQDMSQDKLAELVGVTRQTIYLWESNQNLPDVEKIAKLCDVLNITLPDLVDGMNIKENISELNDTTDNTIKKRKINIKVIVKSVILLVLALIIVYIMTSTIKFFRLKNILSKWEEIDRKDNYYFNYVKIYTDKDGSPLEEAQAYEVYLKNNILITVYKNVKTQDVSFIMIDDFNTNERITTDEENKTYKRSNIDIDTTKLSSYLPNTLKFDSYSNSSILAVSFDPKYIVKKNKENYIIEVDSLTTIINKDTGLIFYEEDTDKNTKLNSCVKYFTVELDTNKEFVIDLDNYTEIN